MEIMCIVSCITDGFCPLPDTVCYVEISTKDAVKLHVWTDISRMNLIIKFFILPGKSEDAL